MNVAFHDERARRAPGRHVLTGTIRVFSAEALILPAGLITTALLTRKLGAGQYGLFMLASTLVAWIEWTVTAVFARATYKCVGEAADWRPVATTVLRLHLFVSTACAAAVAVLAGPVAAALGEPDLAWYLRMFAVDIPIFSVAHAHRHVLVGLGGFRQRAWLSAGRWTGRLVLMLVLVGLGLSIPGAILACIGASIIELAIARRFIRPSLRGPAGFPARQLWGAALPLFLCAMSLRLVGRLDLLLLKALGATAGDAGVYGVAQNLAVVPGIFSMSFSPLLLATLTRLLRDGAAAQAREMARRSMRSVLLLLPLAGLSAGAAGEIVRLIAGAEFAGAAPILAVLIFGAVAAVMISVNTAILTAAGRAGWTVAVAGPLVPAAVAGHLAMIPRFGAMGAAAVTTGLVLCGALLSVAAVYRLWRVAPSLSSLGRGIALSAAACALAAAWPVSGWWVPAKLLAISALIGLGVAASGELGELGIARTRGLRRASPLGDLRHWEQVGAEWRQTRPDTLWRAHSDAVHRALLAAWLPQRRMQRILKTDLFDEAVSGGLCPTLVPRAESVTGMDVSLPTVAAARARASGQQAVCADVRRLPFATATFDAVVSNSTLDHFRSEEELVTGLRELRRVLRPGGELLLTLDNPANPIVALRNALPFVLLYRIGLTPYQVGVTCGRWRLCRVLDELGLEVRELAAVLHCPRVVMVRVARALERRGDAAERDRFLERLMKWERLARWPSRWLTGYYVAVRAVAPELAIGARPSRAGMGGPE